MTESGRLTRLRRLLVRRFSVSELRTLSFDLGIDYEELPGDTKSDKARELVAYVDRRGRVHDLIETGKRLRPDVSWDEIPDEDREEVELDRTRMPEVDVTVESPEGILVRFRVWFRNLPAQAQAAVVVALIGLIGTLAAPLVERGVEAILQRPTPTATVTPQATDVPTTPPTDVPATEMATNISTELPPATTTATMTATSMATTLTGQILFSRFPDREASKSEICIWTVQGDRLHCLSRSGFRPDWPPDKDLIAVDQGNQDLSGIYRMATDGSNLEEVPINDSYPKPRDPVWSPDGKRLAFVAEPSAGDQNIYVFEDDGRVRQITTNPGADFSPDWSPDTVEPRQLLFTSWYDIEQELRLGIYSVAVGVPVPEESRQLLFSTSAGAGLLANPIWSPNGRQVAFVYDHDVTEICVMDVFEGTFGEALCYAAATDRQGMAWSPDSRFVAYTVFDEMEDTQIVLLDVRDGTTSILLEQKGYRLSGLSWE